MWETVLISSHPYASINWIRFIGLTSAWCLSALMSTPLRRDNYITSEMPKQACLAAPVKTGVMWSWRVARSRNVNPAYAGGPLTCTNCPE